MEMKDINKFLKSVDCVLKKENNEFYYITYKTKGYEQIFLVSKRNINSIDELKIKILEALNQQKSYMLKEIYNIVYE